VKRLFVFLFATLHTVLSHAQHSLLWKFTAGAPFYSSPAISGNNVYFGSSDMNLGSILSDPLVEGHTVYFGDTNGYFYALQVK
jgi:outer membrane protein assembly factor BamB